MSGKEQDPKPRRKYGPLRLAMPWIAIVVGVVLGVRGLIEHQSTGDPLFITVGFGLAALGVVMFFVYRWMAKRGL